MEQTGIILLFILVILLLPLYVLCLSAFGYIGKVWALRLLLRKESFARKEEKNKGGI